MAQRGPRWRRCRDGTLVAFCRDVWHLVCCVCRGFCRRRIFFPGCCVLLFFFVADVSLGWDWLRRCLLHLSFWRRALWRWYCILCCGGVCSASGLGCLVVYIFVVYPFCAVCLFHGVITCGAHRGVVLWRLFSASPVGDPIRERRWDDWAIDRSLSPRAACPFYRACCTL